MPVAIIFGFFILLNAAMMWIASPSSVSLMGVFGAIMVSAIMLGVLLGAAQLLDEDLEQTPSADI